MSFRSVSQTKILHLGFSYLDSAPPFLFCFLTSALCRFIGLATSRSLVALSLMLSWSMFSWNNLEEGWGEGEGCFWQLGQWGSEGHSHRQEQFWAEPSINISGFPNLPSQVTEIYNCPQYQLFHLVCNSALPLATDFWHLLKPILVPLTKIPVASSAVWLQSRLLDIG